MPVVSLCAPDALRNDGLPIDLIGEAVHLECAIVGALVIERINREG
jgi:hypothetical protein